MIKKWGKNKMDNKKRACLTSLRVFDNAQEKEEEMKIMKKKISQILLSSMMVFTMVLTVVPTNVLGVEHNIDTDSISTRQEKSVSKRNSLLDLQDSNYILDKDGHQITASDGVFDVMDSEGWKFDSNTQTLTLNGINFETDENPSIIMPRKQGAKVVLVGENTISNSHTNAIDMSSYPLIIDGNGTLTANTEEACIAGYNGIIIKGGQLNLTSSNSDGILSPFGDVVISSGKLSLSTVKGNGIFTENDIFISGGIVNSYSYYCGLQARGADGIKIDNATVVINSINDYGIWASTSLAITNNSDVTVTGARTSIGAGSSVTIEPIANESVDVFVGDTEYSAELLSGAPFSAKTDLKALNVAANLYFHSKVHTHTASTVWSKDVTSHWHECTANDGGKMDLAYHTFGDWVIDTPATETETGSKHRVCTVCGQNEMVEIPVVSHTHKPATDWSKDVTSHWHECIANDGEKMNLAYHTFGDWVIDTSSTETETGSKHRVCTVCGQNETVEIPVVSHTHKPAADWSKDVTSHWHECMANDGKKMDLASHTFGDWVIDTSSTETETGSKHRVCTVCGQNETVEIPVVSHPHKPSKEVIVDKATGTKVEYEDGSSFDSEVQLVVTPISAEEMKKHQENINKVVSGKTIAGVYDIKLLKNGVEIQPDGKLKITLPLTSEMKAISELQVVYIDDKGNVTIIPSQLIDGKLVFVTDHFSYYGVIGKEQSIGQIQPETPSKPNSPQTGDTSNTRLYFGLIILSGCLARYGLKKKRAQRR